MSQPLTLVARSRENRQEMTEPELRVRQAVETGQLADFRVGESEQRTVQARLLMELLTKAVPANGALPHGVMLRGAHIAGALDLRSMKLTCPLLLQDCHLDAPINLYQAEAKAIRLPGSHVPGLLADQLVVTGNLELNNGFTANGEVRLAGAQIGGQLNCDGAHLINANGRALDAYQLTVDQNMQLRDGFTAEGEVHLSGAKIAGSLNCSGGHFTNPNPNGRALSAYQLTVGRDVYLRDGFAAVGEVHLGGAQIEGQLNCDGAHLVNPNGRALDAYQLTVGRDVYLRNGFTGVGEVHLGGAKITGSLNCSGCHLTNPNPDGRALAGYGLTVTQSVIFGEGFTVEGEVSLFGANIGGLFNCNGAALDNQNSKGPALNAAGLTVGQDMYLQKPFSAKGEVRLTGARIGGQLNCSGGHFTSHHPDKPALNAYRLTVGQDMICREGFTAEGEVHLNGAQITGSLNCTGGSFTNLNPDGRALGAYALTVTQGVLFGKGFTAKGEVSLVGANIRGHLNCNGATFINHKGRALDAYRLTVGQDVLCKEGFTAQGEVHLNGAQITGSLNCSGGTFTNYDPRGCAIDANRLTVVDVFCQGEITPQSQKAFTAVGEVRLSGAHITGSLNCSGGHFTNPNPGRCALNAYSLTADQNVFFQEGFVANGEVRLVAAKVGGQLNCSEGSFSNPQGDALNLRWTSAATLILRPKKPLAGIVRLTNAHVGTYHDSKDTWPADLRLDGFTYGTMEAQPPVNVKERLGWLKHHRGDYAPQLYEELAKFYRNAGREDDARTVAIAKQRRRRQTLNPAGKAWNSLLRWTVGYGYQTWIAGLWLLVLVVLGWWIFDRAHSAHPAHLVAAKPPGQRPWFHGGLYALDLLLPFVDLGYQGAWITSGWARWFYLGWNLAGWVLITMVIAALSGLIKRN
jgi:hypothetical protein